MDQYYYNEPLHSGHDWEDDRHFVLKSQDDFGRLLQFALQEQEFAGHKVAGDFLIAYKADFACWLSYPQTGSPIWNHPGKNNARISIGVYDRYDLHMIHDLDVTVTVFDEQGHAVGTQKHPFLFRPHHNQYGENWQLPGDGKYTLQVRIDVPETLRHWEGKEYSSPVIVAFPNVDVCTGHMVS
jgi:hypothetical protein